MTTRTLHRTHEIIELTEDYDHESKISRDIRKKHSFEDDINKFFEAIEVGSSRRGIGHKSAMKRPMRVGPSHASGIGISESVSLKQALRGLCISQASEMAAVKKRISRPSASPGLSDLGASKKLYIEASEGQKGNFMEISFVPKRAVASKNRSQHSEGLKKDVDYETSKIVHPTPSPISEKGCEKLEKTNKGEFSQSSKSSIGEYSTTTSYSDDSHLSGSSRNGYRPHMSKDSRWEAITSIQKHHGKLGMKHFKLLRKIGGGDIATVYLAELIETSCLFAVKVIDNEYLSSRKKLQRAQTEKEILEILDHPFLPTLFAHFTTNKYSCLVMEYCPGGDLHVLRQKQPTKSFPEKAARFYAAEILLALEYLHMLGVVYRDLKPENILVREDGHIMLSDFDLSLRCTANHTLLNSSPKKISDSSCIDPFCLQPSWQLSCFTPKFLTRKVKSDLAAQIIPLPQLVVEPTTARSNSFVGTHEYLAPEIIKGEGHGSAVDWWTFGVFFYELLYGSTPFKGSSNDETISNVVSRCVEFPRHPTVSSHARDLIRRLLKKEPDNRLGSAKGAAEIKQHPFFEGLNWALIRCETPPELPKLFDAVLHGKESKQASEFEQRGDEMEFEMF